LETRLSPELMTIRPGVVGPDIGAPVAEHLSSLLNHSLRICSVSPPRVHAVVPEKSKA